MHQDTSTPAAGTDFDAALRAEQIPYLYQLLPNLIGASIAAGSVLVIASLEHAAQPALLGWAVAMCVALLLRLPLLGAWRRSGAAALQRRWLWAFRLAIFITGCLWGVGALLMYQDAPADFRAMLVMTIAGMGAASAASMAVDRVSAFGFTVTALPPLLVLLFIGGSSLDYSLALLMLLGAIFVVLGVLRTHALLVENIRLRLDSAAQARALRDSEARWRFALEGGGDGVADCDLVSGRAVVSRRWREIEGNPEGPAELALCDWTEAIHPDDRARAQAEFQRSLSGAENCSALECRIGSEAGGWRWVAMRAMVVSRRENGRPLRVIATRTDIDEQKRTFAALLESRERLQLIFDAVSDSMVLRDADGRLLASNRSAQINLDAIPERLDGLEELPSGMCLVDARGRQLSSADLPTVIATRTGKPVRDVEIGRVVDGTLQTWNRVSVEPLLDAQGRTLLTVASCADITERKRNEQAVEESRRRLQLIFDATTDGLVLRDRHGRVLECNAAALRILGLTPAQIGDEAPLPAGWRTVREDGTQVPLADHPTTRALRTGQAVSATVMGLSAPEREVRWISTSVIPLLDADGQVSVVVTSYADVSARVLAEQRLDRRNQELEQASREARALAEAKSTFLANISHEIRSPLAAILGYADRALARGEDLAALRKALDTTQRSARHLLQIVNDVLDAAQLDAGQLHIAASEADAVAVSADVIDLLGPVAEAKQLYLRLHILWPLPRLVQADPLRLKQVLVNLVGNALKFTEQGGVELEIGADAERQRLWIAVSDSGIGMSLEQQQRLFQPFMQGDASHSRRFGGTGLGLYISAELMRRMGGSIAVEHSTPAGSRLRIEMPIRADLAWISEPQSALPAGPPQRPSARYQGRVLLAEDDPFLQALTITWLEDRGLAVDAVDDGQAALHAAQDRDYDLILMDMHMPGLDGHSATLALRAAGCRLPIIALTADMLPASVQAHRQAGCTAVLGKPVSLEELDTMLSRHLRQPVAEPA
ncbi:MAG: ATP-binding protein [Lysobacterales bacterium]